jgi:hypothetical protein
MNTNATMKHAIAQTRNGAEVYVNLVRSPAAAHIAAQPYLLGLVKEALAPSSLKANIVSIEQDMGRDIGYDFVAETKDGDAVFYAQLVHQETFTRFVKNTKPRATHYLTMVLKRDDEGQYELDDTWVGRLSPPLPGSYNETQDSKSYWSTHAYIFDRQPLQLRTVTRVCPY